MEIRLGHPEDALDASRIAHGDLDVILGAKGRAGIEDWVLDEYAFHRVKGSVTACAQAVDVIHNRAIEIMSPV